LKLSKVENEIENTISKKRSKSKMAKFFEVEKESKKKDGGTLPNRK